MSRLVRRLDSRWVGALREAVNGGLGVHCALRDVRRLRLCLASETGRFLVAIDSGQIASAGVCEDSTPCDLVIRGPDDEWEKVFSSSKSLPHALNPVHGALRVEGDPEVLFGNMAAINALIALGIGQSADPHAVARGSSEADEIERSQIRGYYITVQRTTVHVEECGSGHPLLLMHTAGGDSRQWHGVMARLASRYRLITFDLPGHGLSWPMQGEASPCLTEPSAYARFTWSVVERLSLARPWLVGCSMGGNIALQMAAERSDAVSGVIAFQAALHTATASQVALSYLSHPRVNLTSMTSPQTWSLIGENATRSGVSLLGWQIRQRAPASFQADMMMYNKFDLREIVGTICCPTLLVHGDADWLVSRAMVEQASQQISGAQIVSLAGLGHFPPVEDCQRSAALIERFIESNSAILNVGP